MLTKIAVLVDFYQCHEAVHIFSKLWLTKLKNQIPTAYDRDLVLWLSTSSVFLQTDILLNASKTAVKHARGLLSPLGLPIRRGVIEAIESWRKQYMGRLVSRLNDRLLKLQSREAGCCSFECQSMSLGALTIEMSQAGLLQPRSQTPYLGHSIAATIKIVRGFNTPKCRSINAFGSINRFGSTNGFGSHTMGALNTCDSLSVISAACQEIEDAIERLTLEDLQRVESDN
ncbi:hypothetical protein HD806DRAFT_493970 [Xylariaceae sp. AK1471]|nr:hypothetical protein HD806DRAFT_493970 [Xylariaceae sp. AK1471]